MEKIIIFGAGSDGLNTYHLIQYLSVFDVVGFADNNSKIQNRELIDGLIVYAPRDLYGVDFDKILIASTYHQEIKSSLKVEHPELYEKLLEPQCLKAGIYANQKPRFQKMLTQVRAKSRIKVVFFVIHQSTWKLDKLYQLMSADDYFEPVILICPDSSNGGHGMISDMNKCHEHFVSKNYNSILSWQNDRWIDVNKELDPDIVFFTNPHNITLPEYQISSFVDRLTCYYPYGYIISSYDDDVPQFNSYFHNLLWLFFTPCQYNEKLSKRVAANKGDNVRVVGYTFGETLLDNKQRRHGCEKKNIIYAPHHTICESNTLAWSTFIKYGERIVTIFDQYRDRVDFYFKPHPLLKSRLYLHPEWGKDKTDAYYDSWGDRYISDDYVELFSNSDALIHDCGSFLIEYMYLDKPMAYLIRDDEVRNRFNEIGQLAFDVALHVHSEEEIHSFIDDVLCDRDRNRFQRNKFINEIVLRAKLQTPSQNIIDVIKNEINAQNL